MRFSLPTLFLLTSVIGVALATTLAAASHNNGLIIHDVLQLSVVLLSAAALTTGLLSSGKIQVFCLTWGIFFITQNFLHSTPVFVKDLVEDALIPLSVEFSGHVMQAETYVFMITGIWFDVGVATIAACGAVMLTTSRRLENPDIPHPKAFEQNENN